MPNINLGVLVHALMVITKTRQNQRNYPACLCANSERGMHYSVFERSGDRFVKKTHQNKDQIPSSDSIRTDI